MKKPLINKQTIKLAQQQMVLSFKKAYVAVQHALIASLKNVKTEEEKKEIEEKIKEEEKIYLETLEKLQQNERK